MEFLKFLPVLIIPLLTGCSHVSYLFQAGMGQWSLYNHERPIDEVLKDPRTSSKTKERLSWVPEMRKFVEVELGVKSTSNYTTYVDLKRPYVSYIVSVAEPFELKAHEWSFPIVGSFPYLGYFDEKKAEKMASEESSKGFDAYVRGASAYSTLGYLRDPLLSSMLSSRKRDLANLLFHETTHSYVYIKGEGGFNEQAASFIGDSGERFWIEKILGISSEDLKQWDLERGDRRLFGSLLRTIADDLKKVYEKSKTSEEKQKVFEKYQNQIVNAGFKSTSWQNYSKRFAKTFDNNAVLLAHLTYEDHQDVFDKVFAKNERNVRKSMEYLQKFASDWKSIKSDGENPVQTLERLLK